jgi:hypothetical protein
MLTGMLAPTDGYAVVGGRDVRSEMSKIRQETGICLQHVSFFLSIGAGLYSARIGLSIRHTHTLHVTCVFFVLYVPSYMYSEYILTSLTTHNFPIACRVCLSAGLLVSSIDGARAH